MRWIIRIVGILLLMVVVAVVSLLFLPAERIARIAADQISAATGRKVSISGDVSMSLYPVLGVSAGGLEVGGAPWSDKGPLLTAERAAIGLDAMALLSGDIRIRNVEADGPTIRLESRKDGRVNWEFTAAEQGAQIATEAAPQGSQAPAQGTEPPAQAGQAFWIERLRVKNATLIYDAEGADIVQYSGVDLALDWADRAGAAQIDAALRPAGSPVTLAATIGNFSGFLNTQVQPVTAVLKGGGGQVRLDGRASLAGAVAGDVALNLPDTNGFLRALGLPGVDLPRGLGRGVEAKAALTLTEGRQLALRGLSADLGGNSVQGDADIALNGIPQVNAKLSAGALDLTGLGGGSAGASAAGGSGNGAGASAPSAPAPKAADQGWSRAPIDASGLAAFNGAISLRAASMDFGTIKLGATRALLTNDRSRMVFELREAGAYDGNLSGEFVVNNRNGLSVGGKLFGKGLQMQPMLRDLAGLTRLSGAADAELKFLGVGQSVHAIMQSLSGNGAIKLGRGTIEGFDLDELMRSGKGTGGTTVFDSLGATFAMQNGNLQNNDLLALLPNFEARGAGRIGLGAQDIDYLFTPKSLRGNDGRGIAIPVRIRGPWADPKIRPDLEKAIDLNFAEEKKKIEKRVKKKVQQKVAKELGVEPAEGQSIEDAVEKKIEKKLENELKKGLKSLFD